MLFRSVTNFDEQFLCLRGVRGIHLFTMANITMVPYYSDGQSMVSGIPHLGGIEWMPHVGYLQLDPGQHFQFLDQDKVRSVYAYTQTSRQDTIVGWIGDRNVNILHDTGLPYSFHNKNFRLSLKGKQTPEMWTERVIRARGFFDDPHKPAQERKVRLFRFKVKLSHDGKEHTIISHEMPPDSCTCATMLIGRAPS